MGSATRGGGGSGAAALLAAVVIALDQGTKAWALSALDGRPSPLTVVPGLFDLVLGRNTGGVFGLLAGPPSLARRAFFLLATVVALAAILVLLRRWGRESRLVQAALSLVAGGAVGNLVDRLRFGSVVDFIDWHWRGHHWPTFNIADSAITLGAALIILHSFLPERAGEPPPAREGDPA